MILRNLFSSRNMGPLYHYTSGTGALAIMESGVLLGSEKTAELVEVQKKIGQFPKKVGLTPTPEVEQLYWGSMDTNERGKTLVGISLTRNKNFHREMKIEIDLMVRFTFDGNELSHRHRIVPIDFFHYKNKNYRDYLKTQQLNEDEHRFGWYTVDEFHDTFDEDEEVLFLTERDRVPGGYGIKLTPKNLVAVELIKENWVGRMNQKWLPEFMDRCNRAIEKFGLRVSIKEI